MTPATDSPPANRRAVVVLGMHRSGTSAVAGCLQRLGVDFGPRLMPPTPDNARGFYEHIDIVNLHDRLLLSAGSSWDDTDPPPPGWLEEAQTGRFRDDLRALLQRDFGAAPLWGLKDPRLCRLLPWWQPLWAELRTQPLFVIMLRDPREVVASLARRDGFSPGKAYLLWLQHTLAAERDTRGSPRVFVDFADFLADWRQALSPVESLLDAPWPEAAAQEPFVDGALPRANQLAGSGKMPRWVEELDASLRRERRTGAELSAVADEIARRLEAAQEFYGSATGRTDDLTRQYAALQRQALWYEAEWQKAHARAEKKRAESEKRQNTIQSLKNRILDMERVVADVRVKNMSDVRMRRGLLARFFSLFHRF